LKNGDGNREDRCSQEKEKRNTVIGVVIGQCGVEIEEKEY
jgi:hypothetical protein